MPQNPISLSPIGSNISELISKYSNIFFTSIFVIHKFSLSLSFNCNGFSFAGSIIEQYAPTQPWCTSVNIIFWLSILNALDNFSLYSKRNFSFSFSFFNILSFSIFPKLKCISYFFWPKREINDWIEEIPILFNFLLFSVVINILIPNFSKHFDSKDKMKIGLSVELNFLLRLL